MFSKFFDNNCCTIFCNISYNNINFLSRFGELPPGGFFLFFYFFSFFFLFLFSFWFFVCFFDFQFFLFFDFFLSQATRVTVGRESNQSFRVF